jgi:hypothetical protein
MRELRTWCAWSTVAVVLTASTGCIPTYDGQRYPRIVEKEQVRVADAVPSSHAVTGKVTLECTRSNYPVGLGPELLLKIAFEYGCNPNAVADKFRAKVAAVGGDLLVAPRCKATQEKKWTTVTKCSGKKERVEVTITRLRCDATVARPYSLPLETGREAWAWK